MFSKFQTRSFFSIGRHIKCTSSSWPPSSFLYGYGGSTANSSLWQKTSLAVFLTTAGVASLTIHHVNSSDSHMTKCAAYTNNNSKNNAALAKTGGDVVMLGPTKEKATGILFPNLCNAMTFVGCGVRVKYGFVKVCVCEDVCRCVFVCCYIFNVLCVICDMDEIIM